ncbi:hypothetical protein FF098_007445 [Parvularcula flava]|uniref:Uncharacterized protein n=1 Tax=Aquisalinus luteolus TaxID=1566827 RepID=A0A8J3A2Y9_9PROT|nr:hypothetical protein [Aquisalinus luteolus]NHK27731.1 hypothetical protein [Aquisalinus luteolus]GGH96329.1 hypothetical protein GCM10011355_14970 [Aquisalinus luteolus]
MIRKTLAAAASAALLSACVTEAVDPYDSDPPGLERAMAQLMAGPACLDSDFIVGDLHGEDHPHLEYTEQCVAPFPASLERAGISGRCEVGFDIDPEGVPVDVAPSCTAWTNLPDWKPFAEAMFAASATRAMEHSRFQRPADFPQKTSTGLVQPVRFEFAE